MAVKTSSISGFPEYLPAQQRAFDAISAKIRGVYESFGYTPLETAAVERTETLISKGIDAKEVYGLRRLAASTGAHDDDTTGAKELALRFDLTVPTARYVAQNYGQLVFPFRRHQIQPVWRGERPQKGRYRQFHQCDIDYIADGTGNLPLAADAEILACAYTALSALGLKFTMRVNNRKLLQGVLEWHDFPEAVIPQAIKVIDDVEKIGRDKTREKLVLLRGNTHPTDNKDLFLDIFLDATPQPILQFINNLKSQFKGRFDTAYPNLSEGCWELERVYARLCEILEEDLVNKNILLLPTIARGLDYYTGTVVETTLQDAPELGSICSGGRYENLAESLSERALPGVGISIGLGRLGMWLVEQAPWNTYAATPAQVYVAYGLGNVASQLRAAGVAVEEGLEDKPLGKQLQIAEKRGHTCAVVKVEGESLTLRTFATRADEVLSVAGVAKALHGDS